MQIVPYIIQNEMKIYGLTSIGVTTQFINFLGRIKIAQQTSGNLLQLIRSYKNWLAR